MALASSDIWRKARAFVVGVLFLVRKLEALDMSALNFCTSDPIGVSFSFPFLFLTGWEGEEASGTFFCLPQAPELLFDFFSAKSMLAPHQENFF